MIPEYYIWLICVKNFALLWCNYVGLTVFFLNSTFLLRTRTFILMTLFWGPELTKCNVAKQCIVTSEFAWPLPSLCPVSSFPTDDCRPIKVWQLKFLVCCHVLPSFECAGYIPLLFLCFCHFTSQSGFLLNLNAPLIVSQLAYIAIPFPHLIILQMTAFFFTFLRKPLQPLFVCVWKWVWVFKLLSRFNCERFFCDL